MVAHVPGRHQTQETIKSGKFDTDSTPSRDSPRQPPLPNTHPHTLKATRVYNLSRDEPPIEDLMAKSHRLNELLTLVPIGLHRVVLQSVWASRSILQVERGKNVMITHYPQPSLPLLALHVFVSHRPPPELSSSSGHSTPPLSSLPLPVFAALPLSLLARLTPPPPREASRLGTHPPVQLEPV
ncbi:hypothetical protein BV22DRAFT_913189 [Leucogyrophana mollusca]|uniref:Uncharacterized protein n=1 Tax=Leucogyrophana mollusca TaxID=85980 RepID=A0ACB8AZF6_9AGAM|nr:hypothetical protein BV22DRAFT_913189 [Leucogyrophana mollusca]